MQTIQKEHNSNAHDTGNLADCHGCIAVLMATQKVVEGKETYEDAVEATDAVREGPGGAGFDLVDDGYEDGDETTLSMFKVPATLKHLRAFAESALKVCNEADRILAVENNTPAARR